MKTMTPKNITSSMRRKRTIVKSGECRPLIRMSLVLKSNHALLNDQERSRIDQWNEDFLKSTKLKKVSQRKISMNGN